LTFNKDLWDRYICSKNPIILSSVKSIQHGIDHFNNRDNEDDRRHCIVEIDQAVELFLKGILLNQGKNPYHMRFPQLLEETKDVLELSEKERVHVSRLHKVRDACQHEGHIPGKDETEYLVNFAIRFYLDKAKKLLRITPDKMVNLIPGLLLMGIKKVQTGRGPEKPEVLRHMEAAAEALLVLGDFERAFHAISKMAAEAIEILYEKENDPTLDELDPLDLTRQELGQIVSFEARFKKVKVDQSGGPFHIAFQGTLYPTVVYAIKKLSHLTAEGAIHPDVCQRILRMLRGELLRSMRNQFPAKGQRMINQYLRNMLTFEFLVKEFVFLRGFVMSSDVVSQILRGYYDKLNDASFRRIKEA